MRLTNEAIDLIKRWESYRGKPYICSAGKVTIGYGSTFYPDKTPVKMSDPAITEKEAEGILLVNLEVFERDVKRAVKVELTDNEYSALVSFCYNIGGKNFTTSTLVKLLNAGEEKGVVAEQFSRWVFAGKRKLNGLVSRRADEKKMFLGQ